MPNWIKSTWQSIKAWSYKYIGGLFMEPKNGGLVISLGRTSFIAILAYLVSFWNEWRPTRVSLEDVMEAVKAAGAKPAAVTEAIAGLADAMATPPEALPPGLMQVFFVCAGWVGATKGFDALKARSNDKK